MKAKGLAVFIALFSLSSCSSTPSSRHKHGLFDYDPNGVSSIDAPRSSSQARRADGGTCRPLTMRDRLNLLQVANPDNFPRTKYRRGSNRSVEQETDCSHFVHEIYRRAGFPYSFRTTADLREAPEFEMLPEEEAMPGDLMLFRGHVGLVDNDGRIISSTYRRGRRPSSITRFQRTVFKPLRGRISVMRYRCQPDMQAEAAELKPVKQTVAARETPSPKNSRRKR